MSMGNPSGANWGQPGGLNTGTPIDAAMPFIRPYLPGFMQQFNPTQNITDTAEAQRFQAMQIQATSFAASNAQVVAAVNALIMQTNAGLRQLGISSNISQMSTQATANMVSGAMPMISQMGGSGMLDSLGFGGPGFTGALANSQRSFIYQHPEMNAQATGQRLGEIGKTSYEQLFNSGGSPRGNTYGFGGGQSGEAAAAGMRRGWGGNNLLQEGRSTSDSAAEMTSLTKSTTRLASAVRDMGGQFANMGMEQLVQTGQDFNLGGARMSQGDMSAHIRRQTALSKMAKLSPEQTQGLQMQAGEHAQSLGLNRSIGTVSTEHGTAAGVHLQSHAAGQIQEGTADLNTMRKKDIALVNQAINSDVGKQMATLAEFGKLSEDPKSGIKLTGEAAAKYADLVAGKYKWMDEGKFIAMLRASGISGEQVVAALADPSLRDKHGREIASNAREQQWEVDVAPNLSIDIANAIEAESGNKLKPHRSKKIARLITETLSKHAGKAEKEVRAAVVAALMNDGVSARDAAAFTNVALTAGNVLTKRLGYANVFEAVDLHSGDLHAANRQAAQDANAQGQHAEDHAGEWMPALARGIAGFATGGIMGAIKGFAGVGAAVDPHASPEKRAAASDKLGAGLTAPGAAAASDKLGAGLTAPGAAAAAAPKPGSTAAYKARHEAADAQAAARRESVESARTSRADQFEADRASKRAQYAATHHPQHGDLNAEVGRRPVVGRPVPPGWGSASTIDA